jgi:predicted SAM-dependent methyltransferase
MKKISLRIEELQRSNEPVQLHLACGKRNIPGFLHIDRDQYGHVDHVCDIGNLEPVPDYSVNLIYCCHALGYFDFKQVPDVLKEWNRVLRPGGTLRLSVPDFNKVIQIYGQNRDMSLLYGFLYGRYVHAGQLSGRAIYYRIIFNYESLGRFLADSGFENYRCYDWRATIHKDYDDYSQAYIPHMDKDNGTMMSLNIEVDKPA